MKDTLNSIYKHKIIQNYKNENDVNIICKSYDVYKNYFINSPAKTNHIIEFNTPNIIDLTTLLVSKYGLEKFKIQNKLYFLANMKKNNMANHCV